MVVADQASDMHDVFHHLVEGGGLGHVVGHPVRVVGLDARDEGRVEVDHDQGVSVTDELEDVVLDVARVRADAVGGAVAVDDGGLAPGPAGAVSQDVPLRVLASSRC